MRPEEKAVGRLKAEGLYRRLRTVTTPQAAEFELDGRRVINFSGNNALGLAVHPAPAAAAREGLERYGLGSGASRLISGNMAPHMELERDLAAFLGREGALYFPSGYQANTGALPALTGEGDVILSDALNHASLIDGIRLSRAECRIYPHNDMKALEKALREIPEHRRVMVVTESLFSMEGDRAPLGEITALKRVRPFLLYVDEAHALGALGPGGRGLAAETGCGESVDLLLGTLGKGVGVAGAFIAARSMWIELLINKARTFIYTTAPPPMLAAAARAALVEVERGDALRQRLVEHCDYFRNGVREALDMSPPGEDHIVPLPVPGAERVMQVSEALLSEGVFCQGIRPPTVPPGACRLRFSLSALHTVEHLDTALSALKSVWTR